MNVELWAEAGPCDKSVDAAMEYVRRTAEAGATALKVQWYNPETTFTPDAPRYDNTAGDAKTQWEAAANPIYPYGYWEPVIEACRDYNIKFIPSVFDFEAIDAAAHFGLHEVKIASGDLTYHSLVAYAAKNIPRLAISTGAATLEEIKATMEIVGPGHILMACHLEYPTPLHRANIARSFMIQDYFREYDITPGFSDHTPGINTIPLIVATGVGVIEKHFTLAQGRGYDSEFALAPVDLRNAVLSIDATLRIMGHSDLQPTAEEMAARQGARRSPYLARDIKAGETITESDIIVLRPNYGVDPEERGFVGMVAERDMPKYSKVERNG